MNACDEHETEGGLLENKEGDVSFNVTRGERVGVMNEGS